MRTWNWIVLPVVLASALLVGGSKSAEAGGWGISFGTTSGYPGYYAPRSYSSFSYYSGSYGYGAPGYYSNYGYRPYPTHYGHYRPYYPPHFNYRCR